MKVKNVNLEWKVLRHDSSSNEIKEYNVFRSDFIVKLHKEVLKKNVTNYEQLKEFINKDFMYYYWSKSECEILVGGLLIKDMEKDLTKIDIYTQLKMNLDRITEYVNKKLNLKF